MKNELYTMNQYGKITIDIKTFMDEKRINRNMLARAINARFEVIDKWYGGHVEKIDADVLALLCTGVYPGGYYSIHGIRLTLLIPKRFSIPGELCIIGTVLHFHAPDCMSLHCCGDREKIYERKGFTHIRIY